MRRECVSDRLYLEHATEEDEHVATLRVRDRLGDGAAAHISSEKPLRYAIS